jgi:NAD+ kinase
MAVDSMIRTISINFRPDDSNAVPFLRNLINFLHKEKIAVYLPEYDVVMRNGFKAYAVDQDTFVDGADLIIVIGGDGTFLRTARLFCGTGKPVFGINRGRLGFLTKFNPEEFSKYLKQVLEGRFTCADHLVLESVVVRDRKETHKACFLNDAVIHKGSLSRPIRIELHIDGNFVSSYAGDGLIISTPTGSTAYSLSAGGPIIFPNEMNIYLITPICPHSLGMRPMIISSSSVFKTRIATDHDNLLLTIDGQEAIEIDARDEIVIQQSNKNMKIIIHPEKNYFAILHEKLKWGMD